MNPASSQHRAARLLRLIAIGLSLAVLAALPRLGYSAPEAITRYVVPGGADGNDCLTPASACEHIQAAIDKSDSGDTINIAPGIYLENLEITDKSVTLQGQGFATTIVDGSNQDRVLFLSDDNAATPMSVVVSGLSLRNGRSDLGGAVNNETATVYLTIINSEIANSTATTAGGGGIYNQGLLNLINVVIRENTASASNGYGGGIYNLGEADLNNTTITNNTAVSGGGGIRNTNLMTITNSLIGLNNRSNAGEGGGIANLGTGSRVTLINSIISGNRATVARGGGIYNDSILISSGTVISGNLATEQGGGMYNAASGQVTVIGGSLHANRSDASAGGAFFNAGTAYLTGAVVTNNRASTSGGGVENTGSLSIDTNAISSNTAVGQPGGGINNQGTLTLTRSALVYNAATVSQGGGLRNAGTAQLMNVTVSDNTAASAGGIQNTGGILSIQFSTISNTALSLNNAGGSVTVGNSILAQSTGNACGGTINSADYNIDSGVSCGFNQVHDLSSTNPQLGPLRDNGGNSLTRAIAFASAAVDSAAATCPPVPATDQRGVTRPQSNACDRGASEVVGYTNSTPLPIPASGCVTSTLTVNEQFAVGLMLAGVNLNYANRAELAIRLLSPGSNRVRLLGPAANAGQNLDTLFDDSAATGVLAGDQDPGFPFYNYDYQPATPLLQFRGANIKGTWKLEICNSGSSTGTLNRWVIVVPEVSAFKVYMPIIRRS